MNATRTRTDSQATIQVGALGVRFLVEAADSNGSVSVFECAVPADTRMPVPHSHDAFEETIYGLEGVTSWTVDGRAVEISVGDAFCVPRGAVHGFQNTSAEDAKFLPFESPASTRNRTPRAPTWIVACESLRVLVAFMRYLL